ncbi:glycosyltransferase family 4 protein [Legionella sp. D16C41]|uniref:glycosyltransferase family 4 protein n=1 Tax=Legionella sp. D16C41 TaxID=3402688 RepID=UPI003AF7F772
MRVGLIIYGSINTVTGGFIYDYKLVEYLRSQGVLVKIFSQQEKNFFGLLGNNFSKKLLQDVIDFSPDILLEDELNCISLFLFNKKFKKITNIPIISIVHLLQSNTKQKFLIKALIKKIEYLYLKSVTGFIFNSLATEKTVVDLIGKNNNSLVVYPGKDRLQLNISKEEILLKFKDNKLMIIFVGNVLYNKGLHILLKALAKIDSNLWQLSVIGKLNVDLKYVKKIFNMITQLRLENNVKFFGLLDIENLKTQLLLHHVLIVPSYYESYGIVYTEAMGAGLPVIACKVGGVPEIIDDHTNGFLITPGNSSILQDKILKLLQDQRLLKEMSLASLATYQCMPSWTETMAKMYTFLQQNFIEVAKN